MTKISNHEKIGMASIGTNLQYVGSQEMNGKASPQTHKLLGKLTPRLQASYVVQYVYLKT